MRYSDQKTTIFSEIGDIIEHGEGNAPYDLIDSIIEILTPDQLNQVEDILVNQFGDN